MEDRVAQDPDDFTAWNRLGSLYLQSMRETDSLDFLRLAERAAKRSLAAAPAESNAAGLALRGHVQFAGHDFAAARTTAAQLVARVPSDPQGYLLLGDASVELGAYPAATAAYEQLTARVGDVLEAQCRLSHLAFLKGDVADAVQRVSAAAAQAEALSPANPETLAWCRWQCGELAFARGNYAAAEAHGRASLSALPNYFRARGSLGRALAAQSRLSEAIAEYERATATYPDPTFVAALADLYHLAGREQDARAQHEVMAGIATLSAASGDVYNRLLAVYYANHDLHAEAAYAMALKEYAVRKDIYGADALAWTALKAGRVDAAQAAMTDALQLGTPDAMLHYHAGMIALTAGDRSAAADHLARALSLSPHFDPLHAPQAARALDATRAPAASGP